MGQFREMRWVRSFLVSALTACSAGVAHAGGGGHRAPIALLVVLALVGTPAMYALSRRRWRFGHLLAVMGLAQIALHASMTMSMSSAACHEHLAAILPTGAVTSTDVTPTMLLLHVGMTVALAGCLTHSERLLDRTVRRWLHAVHAPVPVLTSPRPMPLGRRDRLTSALPRAPCDSRAPPVAFVLAH